MSPNTNLDFEFLLFEGFSNMVLASALEPLRDVKMRGINEGLNWQVSSLDGNRVTSSSGLNVMPDGQFDPSKTDRFLVLVAGYHVHEQITPDLLQKTRLAARNSSMILAVDAATWILASAGLLDGHKATIHWQELETFAEGFPKIEVSTARFVRSGRYITCGGASTALDMILSLIQEHFGAAAAFDASTMFIYDPGRQNEMGRGAVRLREQGSPKLLAALDVMAENIENPLTTFELAERSSLSERSLNRLFQRELGLTPGKYYRLFRLKRARTLAQDTQLSQEQIALRCGFASGVSLSRSFRAEFGVSIQEIRRT